MTGNTQEGSNADDLLVASPSIPDLLSPPMQPLAVVEKGVLSRTVSYEEEDGEVFDWLKDVCDVDMNDDIMETGDGVDRTPVPDALSQSFREELAPESAVELVNVPESSTAVHAAAPPTSVNTDTVQQSPLVKSSSMVPPYHGEDDDDYGTFIKVPRISFHTPGNVYSWLYLRGVMQNFGVRVRFRLDCYVGCVTLLLFALMAFVIVTIAEAEDKLGVLGQVDMMQACLAILTVTVFIVGVVIAGALANNSFENHK